MEGGTLTSKVPVELIRPILEREIEARNQDFENGVGGIQSIAEEVSATVGVTAESVTRRLYPILKGWDVHGLRPPAHPDSRPGPAQRLVLRDNDAFRDVIRDALTDGHTRLTAGYVYRWVTERHLRRRVREVEFETADKILTGIALEHLWFTDPELHRFLPPAAKMSRAELDRQHDATCGRCGHAIDWSQPCAGIRVEMHRPPQPGRSYGRWEWWSMCFECAAGWVPFPQEGRDASGVARRRAPDDAFRKLYVAYVKVGLGMEETVRRSGFDKRYGYASARAAARSAERMFRLSGLPIRTRSQAKRANAQARGPHLRMPTKHLQAAYLLHTRHDMSINQIAHLKFRDYGYASPSTCASAISTGWKRLGLKARGRIEMTVLASTKHGLSPRDHRERYRLRREAGLTNKGRQPQPTCTALTQKGKPCTHRSMRDGLCYAHHPEAAAERNANLAAMRARDPRKSDFRLEDATPLIEDLLAWQDTGGTWRQLARLTGESETYISHLARGTMARVDRQRAAALRDAMAAATAPATVAV